MQDNKQYSLWIHIFFIIGYITVFHISLSEQPEDNPLFYTSMYYLLIMLDWIVIRFPNNLHTIPFV